MVDQSLTASIWQQCSQVLQQELTAQQFNTWVRPLSVEDSMSAFILVAPNRFIMDWVNDHFISRIRELVAYFFDKAAMSPPSEISLKVVKSSPPSFSASPQRSHPAPVSLDKETMVSNPVVQPTHHQPDTTLQPAIAGRDLSVSAHQFFGDSGSEVDNMRPSSPAINHYASGISLLEPHLQGSPDIVKKASSLDGIEPPPSPSLSIPSNIGSSHSEKLTPPRNEKIDGGIQHRHGLNTAFTFESFVEGKSNQLGLAAAQQVVENPGASYNPLFIYGGVGLGKTHLMHAVGNAMQVKNPNAKIVYLHSERFVADMVKALQLNAINDFKRYYRSVDALLIDDIQFFAGKDRSQEEFFHTFNALLEGNQQIILTCDRYPKVISNVEERLKSRFGWGLTVEVEPPELETRVAILMKRAEAMNIDIPYDAAFFVAQRVRSNVRELEGALKRVMANASFTQRPITVDLVKEALKDLLALQDKQVSISNIQRMVGEYYKVKVSEFTSKRRSRSVARPRQVAMALAKELTNHSLPEIGEAFGGRDHTTVLHACRKIKELHDTDSEIQQDWKNLTRLLTT